MLLNLDYATETVLERIIPSYTPFIPVNGGSYLHNWQNSKNSKMGTSC